MLLLLAQILRQIAQLRNHRRITDESMKVAQHKQAAPLLRCDVVQRLDGVFDVAALEGAKLLHKAARDRPGAQLHHRADERS